MTNSRAPAGQSLVRSRMLAQKIYELRGERVMIDSDLATLYGVTTKALNQAVRRNRSRFPGDFMFQLSARETAALRSQIVTSNETRGGRRYAPLAFPEQGVAMLSSVLRSPRALHVNIEIMRTFVRLRAFLVSNEQLARRLDRLERKSDKRFKAVFDAIRQLITIPAHEPRRRIGSRSHDVLRRQHPGAFPSSVAAGPPWSGSPGSISLTRTRVRGGAAFARQ